MPVAAIEEPRVTTPGEPTASAHDAEPATLGDWVGAASLLGIYLIPAAVSAMVLLLGE